MNFPAVDSTLLITAGLMLAGLIGCAAPLLPGPPLVWLGALFYAWKTGFAVIGWPTLLLLLVLALIGSTAEFWLGYLGARKTGASPWASLAALLGGFVGLLVFNLPGLIIGSIAAIAAVEYRIHKSWQKVLTSGAGYLAGYLLSVVVEFITCFLMIGIFVAVKIMNKV